MIMKILNFGSCNIDYVYSMDHIVRVGETQATYNMEIFPGGKGLNQSIAIARAGAEVYHAGCIGYDGGMLAELLENDGVDISYLHTADIKNGHAIIQVDAEGRNSIFLYGGSNELISEEFIDSVLENFYKGDILLLQNEISNVEYIINKASQKQMCIVFNPSPLNDEIRKLDFGKLDYLILNEVEAGDISGCDSSDEAIAFFKKQYPNLRVVLTLGEKGCIYSDEIRCIKQDAFRINTVDTTGAGDTFTGYFVAGLSCNMNCEQSLKLASAAAAIAVSRMGAASSVPFKDEVVKMLEFYD